ncbi:MAG: hypothetical protein HUK28_07365, partial [Methanobrevibacter sp.]|nr:hypothetical protein [Methanobrevibacter sp.]
MMVLVCLLSVSAISATDIDNTNETVVLVADTPGTFMELSNQISSAYGQGTLELTKDYKNSDNYSADGIKIINNLIIDGKEHIIDANNVGRIFNISNGANVTLKNINFINGFDTSSLGGGAIYNEGNLIVDNCHFENLTTNSNGGAIYTNGSSVGVVDSKFINTH